MLGQALGRHPGLERFRLRVDRGLCRRVVATPPQQGLAARERRRNLRGAFNCTRRLAGESIAIVDDVLTTGSSAGELARILKESGAGQVQLWCCARTPQPA